MVYFHLQYIINGYHHSNMENLVKKFADDLLRHRKYHYSQESL